VAGRTESPLLALFPLWPIFRGDAAAENARFEEGWVGDVSYDMKVDCERDRRGLEPVADMTVKSKGSGKLRQDSAF
jgi:hypothetical protein